MPYKSSMIPQRRIVTASLFVYTLPLSSPLYAFFCTFSHRSAPTSTVLTTIALLTNNGEIPIHPRYDPGISKSQPLSARFRTRLGYGRYLVARACFCGLSSILSALEPPFVSSRGSNEGSFDELRELFDREFFGARKRQSSCQPFPKIENTSA